MLSEQQQRIMGYFIEEAKDHLNTIEQGLLNLKATIEDPEMANEVFRAAHSVKGGAAMLGLTSIQHTAHRLEDYFKVLKECSIQIDQRLETLLLRVYDTLGELLEQLQGPFGLTDDKAEAAMAEVEPVFTELNQLLSQLVSQSGSQPPEDVNLTAVPAAAPQTTAPLQASTEESALRFIFQTDVPARLREMLQLFKQNDTAATRQQLQSLCQTLQQFGEQLDLPAWCELLELSEQAIAQPENAYRTLAPVVIKDIKRAQEQVLAGQSHEITLSGDLIALVPLVTDLNEEMTDAELADLLGATDSIDDDAFVLFESAPEAETTPSNWADLPEFSTPDFATTAQDSDLEFSFDAVEPENQLMQEDSFDLSLLDQFDEPTPTLSNHETGPEVGMAELNTLADLFEGEAPDLVLDWQEEIINESKESGFNGLEVDSTDDFSDLLQNESGSNELMPEESDDLSDLLNSVQPMPSTDWAAVDDWAEPVSSASNSTEPNQEQAIDEFDDIFTADLLTFEQTSSAASSSEPANDQQRLDELFSGLEDGSALTVEQSESAAEADLGDLFGASDNESGEISELENAAGDDDLSDLTFDLEPAGSLAEDWQIESDPSNMADLVAIDELSASLEATEAEQAEMADFAAELEIADTAATANEVDLDGSDLLDELDQVDSEMRQSSSSADESWQPEVLDDPWNEGGFAASELSSEEELSPFALDSGDSAPGDNVSEESNQQGASDLSDELSDLDLADLNLGEDTAESKADLAIDSFDAGNEELSFDTLFEASDLEGLDQLEVLSSMPLAELDFNLDQGSAEGGLEDFALETPVGAVEKSEFDLTQLQIDEANSERQDLTGFETAIDNPEAFSLESAESAEGADNDSTDNDLDFNLFDEAEIGTQPVFESSDAELSADIELNLFADSEPASLELEEILLAETAADASMPADENWFIEATVTESESEELVSIDSVNLAEFELPEDFAELDSPASESLALEENWDSAFSSSELSSESPSESPTSAADVEALDSFFPLEDTEPVSETESNESNDLILAARSADSEPAPEFFAELIESTSSTEESMESESIAASEVVFDLDLADFDNSVTSDLLMEDFSISEPVNSEAEVLANSSDAELGELEFNQATADQPFGLDLLGLDAESAEATESTDDAIDLDLLGLDAEPATATHQSSEFELDLFGSDTGDTEAGLPTDTNALEWNQAASSDSDSDLAGFTLEELDERELNATHDFEQANLDPELFDAASFDLDADAPSSVDETDRDLTSDSSDSIDFALGLSDLTAEDSLAVEHDLAIDDLLAEAAAEGSEATSLLDNPEADLADDFDWGATSTELADVNPLEGNADLTDTDLTDADSIDLDLGFTDANAAEVNAEADALAEPSNDETFPELEGFFNADLSSDAEGSDLSLEDFDFSEASTTEDPFALRSSSAETGAEPEPAFDDLDLMLSAAEFGSASESADDLVSVEPAAFDDLQAVLADNAASVTEIHTEPEADSSIAFEDDFADLDALLESDGESGEAEPLTEVSAEAEDEFGDLEALLQDADQTLGVGSSPTRKSASTSNRRPSRRSGLSDQTMRVTVKHLDNLNNLVGEMVVNRNSLEQAQERLRQFLDNLLYQVQQLSDVGQRMRDLYERSLLESSLLSSRRGYQIPIPISGFNAGQSSHATGASFDALEMDRFTGFHTLSQEMIELIVRVRESASDIDFVVEESDQVTRNFRQITTQLQEGLTRSRMVPFAQTADRLPRGIRDNSLKYGKQAELIIEGRDTLIDKMIVEQLYDPMTHLVNNAIAHGIETPEERIAGGKPPTGRITIRAFHQGNQTVISVSDDGAGINPERVKAKALAKGLITAAQAREMTSLDTYDLLFHHGFSTADRVDDLRGRGVGLDVVRSNLNEIRGTITIDSAVGKGTTFTIRLPLTLSISKALCCISNRARIAFPMDGVEDMLDVPKERIQIDEQGRQCIQWRDTMLPFQPLADLLRYNRVLGRGSVYGGNQEEDMISIVVLRSAGNFLALQVDQVLGEQEIVIKQLEGPIPKPLGVAGATVLGDGRIMPIADVLELIDLWQGRVRRESGSLLWDQGEAQVPVEPAAKSEPTVLIVDDSITVRELLSMTFSKVGYRVEQARDGQEAWEKLRSGLPCDLVFCDIEMPRMDGLELLSRIQKDANLNHLPIAMLTSRGADRHRQMAVQLGAKGYFTKPYLEEVLLDAAQRMLKGEVMMSSSNLQ